MPSALFGKWKEDKRENFDEYMKVIGVTLLLRKAAAMTTGGTTQITDLGDNKIRINTVSTLKSSDVTFTIGVESAETTMDGRKVKNTFTWTDENTLHQSQHWNDGKRKAVLIWTVENDQLKLTLECDGVKGVWYYNRIE